MQSWSLYSYACVFLEFFGVWWFSIGISMWAIYDRLWLNRKNDRLHWFCSHFLYSKHRNTLLFLFWRCRLRMKDALTLIWTNGWIETISNLRLTPNTFEATWNLILKISARISMDYTSSMNNLKAWLLMIQAFEEELSRPLTLQFHEIIYPNWTKMVGKLIKSETLLPK